MLRSPISKTIVVKFKAISVGAWFRALIVITLAAQLFKNIVLIHSIRLIELEYD